MSDHRLSAIQAANQVDFISHSPAQTERVGLRLGELLLPGDLLLLLGTFGVGKTQLVRGVARGLGSDDLVTSPSFVLVNQYRASPRFASLPIYHVDLYRIAETAELATLGLDELWSGEGVCLIEWPEPAAPTLPETYLAIFLQHLSETKRQIRMAPFGKRYVELLNAFKETTFS
ncbi:tRNA (adenosine(37)-N6)-threonylcarbamoyltransferase complex ATPase subunit type 1 TsaE [Candidatus Chloroploca sp. M-50]|uniref:tRNA threonylcarbamoyladenosine biosynthesis protein TsaE n=1 Tax=Candidatus Chloroploca mongolica TaxID=2528176 RepID=A0ABS4DCF6_9CHLR|nr:tRNA (adenosine(37)-N6)-threonylcarbamoyltransferase complex ATPase subunit type 1 TsaE [Candidatus Chloroploca mongolica]MBP1467137.1 tRNA (adenosine(37)-N6)-threonylcarbamoyltransferase complex ATPase subunit type 1 TsaE [Candidatus Chloroploca mongolica]